jgi:Effector-associated domain 4/NACHT domain
MPKQSYGNIPQKRAQILLLALLDFANDSLETTTAPSLDSQRSPIQTHWQSEKQLVIRTKARHLEELIQLTGQQLSIDQIKTALKHLETFSGVLTDHRTAQRGSDHWHFTLTFWHNRWEREANLQAFNQVWDGKRRGNQHQTITTTTAAREQQLSPSLSPATIPTEEFWSQLCRTTLNTRLSSNPLTAHLGLSLDVGDIYVPLGVIERPALTNENEPTDPPIHQLPSLLHQWQAATTIQHIAIIGEPGVGKTTFLQKIALSLSANQLPIWISLADLAGQSIGDYLTQTWLPEALQTYQASTEHQTALTEICQQGHVWLLLDAVDEMGINPSLALTQIAKQLRGWLANVHVVLTCRLNVWDSDKNALADFQTYQSLGFDHQNGDDQTYSFIQSWFVQQPPLGQALYQELQRPGRWPLKNTLQNPLCLALLCRTWALTQGKLPATKAILYRKFVEALYEWKQDLFPTTRKQRQQLNLVLANLALQAMHQNITFRLTHQLVSNCCNAIDPDLMTLALQIGWLKSVSISPSGDKVYAFSHPTFQEYFAAQATDDGLFFIGKFPIIKWQEIVMLWLGREDLPDSRKESLLSALEKFDDQVGGFYSYRTYFLAAEGLAEFPGYSRGHNLITQLIQWRFGNSDPTLPTILVERAGIALSRSARSLTIPALENFLQTATEPLHRWLAAHSLGKNHDPGNPVAIDTLQNLLQESLPEYLKIDIARSLGTINPGNSRAIDTLTELITTQPQQALQRRAAQRLGRIDPGNHFARQTLERLITEITDPHLQNMTAKTLEQLQAPTASPSPLQTNSTKRKKAHQLAPAQLTKILANKITTTKDPLAQIRLARQIAQLQTNHPQGLNNLLQYFATGSTKVAIKLASESIKELVTIYDGHGQLHPQLPHTFQVMHKIYLSPTNGVQYQESFKLLWYWSRQLSYQDFLQLWSAP